MASAAGAAAAPTSRSLSGSAQAAGAREVGSSARIGEVQIAIAFASHGPLRNCPGCALQTLRSRYPRTKGCWAGAWGRHRPYLLAVQHSGGRSDRPEANCRFCLQLKPKRCSRMFRGAVPGPSDGCIALP